MGPKNISLISTDIPRKDMNWMDRMCLKLESICLEVDKDPSVIFQEASKYVENQMSTVGSNMKKLCAEICDLLPARALDADDGAGAHIVLGENLVEPEKELLQFKEAQTGLVPQISPVKESRDGFNTEMEKLKLSGAEDRQALTSAETGVNSQQANENDTSLFAPVRCRRESSSGMSKEMEMEQYAYWYVDSVYREALMKRILETDSPMMPIENNQKGVADEFDLDWELL